MFKKILITLLILSFSVSVNAKAKKHKKKSHKIRRIKLKAPERTESELELDDNLDDSSDITGISTEDKVEEVPEPKKEEEAGGSIFASGDSKKNSPYKFGAYFRIMARNDFGYNSQTLGWWPLYGRLLNETPWLTVDNFYNIVNPERDSDARVTIVGRVEGNSFRNSDPGMGNLGNYNITQLHIDTENTPWRHFVTQTGTIWYNMGYIGIYDFYVSQAFWETVGFRAGQKWKKLEYYFGVGDAGYDIYNQRKKQLESDGKKFNSLTYNAVPTGGFAIKSNLHKFKLFKNKWIKYPKVGATFQVYYEPTVEANPASPNQTLGLNYADILKGRTLKKYMLANPGKEDFFPGASPASSLSWRATAWFGFALGKSLGPIKMKWNDLSFAYQKKHPQMGVTEKYNNIEKDIYTASLTDERSELWLVDEMQLTLWENHLDMNIGVAFVYKNDKDNQYVPDDTNIVGGSILIRPQYYITRELHALLELSMSVEKSTIGNKYREHWDSIQANTAGIPNKDGNEWGDTNKKYTYQIKFGPVFNPNGRGIYNRPTIRILYGAQYSNVHAAFGNTFNESLTRQNKFLSKRDIHWHHIVSIEAEHWFGTLDGFN